MKSKILKRAVFSLVFLLGIGLLFNGTYIQAKAILAQYLIEESWEKTLETKEPTPPWSWSDTYPILKMSVPSLNKELFVLQGDSGSTLAFGPGHASKSFLPKDNGTVMISAHKDTHFRFLKDLKVGEKIVIQDVNNDSHTYIMDSFKVIDSEKNNIPIYNGINELVLVTCYPFEAISTEKNQRYVVSFREN